MDKGIRPACNAKFAELLPTRAEVGNTAFRKNVMFYVMEEFGITLASAATHYNHAFQAVKAANPELVAGLGRADDKKGGRKPKATVVAEAVAVLLGTPEGAAPEAATLLSEGVKENTSTLTVTVNPAATFTVRKKSDGTVVAEGLSQEAADTLVAKAKAAKKAALEIA
jgi:hypothetical protein